jgi:hypothetical protein
MTYQIADEPIDTPWRHLVVRPSMPLLASMVCGAWLAWPWFAFNAFAMGSPTRRRELALCGIAVGGTAVLGFVVLALARAGVIESVTVLRLALLGIATWKLAMAYVVCGLQQRTFHVYEYYGGPVRQAMIVIGLGYSLRSVVLDLIDDPLWWIIVAGGR